ncbi:type 2 periplasmic-binding domain-containing protein [Dactylosporangium cerinum]
MRHISKVGLGVAGVAVLLLTQATAAHADVAAQGNDIVGIGSDTIQYAADFLADGDYQGNPGFNAAGGRVFNFDATGDASGKLTAGATVVLRGGNFPVTRPNGSGGGLTYFTQTDIGATKKVQFVRSSRKPSKAEDDRAVANGWGGLRCYQLGLDGLRIAVSKTVATNAGTAGISAADLKKIYSSPRRSPRGARSPVTTGRTRAPRSSRSCRPRPPARSSSSSRRSASPRLRSAPRPKAWSGPRSTTRRRSRPTRMPSRRSRPPVRS